MNLRILNTDIQVFINQHLHTSITELLLKGFAFDGIENHEIAAQIEAKKRCEKKLPSWFHSKNIYYPNKLHIEQTSSEKTARYKASVMQGISVIDLTGGFGVDSYYLANRFETVTHCEINKALSRAVRNNYKSLNVGNIKTVHSDGLAYLKSTNKQYSWIYIDPSRRHDKKGKVFFLEDCVPNVPKHLDMFFEYSKNIMIKTAPLLDIALGLNDLKFVKTIHVVAVSNEVKELLWVIEQHYQGPVKIETINLKNEKNDFFSFLLDSEKTTEASYELPLSYLYEPNSAILKAGGFHTIAKEFNLFKLHKHSHLYTDTLLKTFPGRRFKIERVLPYNKKVFKSLALKKANLTVRNFPESVQQIRKKYKIADGGNQYVFLTTNCENTKIIIMASQVFT